MAQPLPKMAPSPHPRLLDALTVRHGPAPLLARFILAGDRTLRDIGLTLRIRTDFDALLHLNKKHVAAGNWLPIPEAFDPKISGISEENAFWVAGENEAGEIVATWGAIVRHWPDTTMADHMREVWYGADRGQPCIVTAEAATRITGTVSCAGAAWSRPDVRGKHLSHLLPRIGKAYACSHWPLDWAVGFISRWNMEKGKGLASSFGQKNLSYSVTFPGSPWGEFALVYTPVGDVYQDLSDYLSGQLLDSEEDGAGLSSTSFAHEVTNTSPETVFQGSNSRS
jgi:hypothetical protein